MHHTVFVKERNAEHDWLSRPFEEYHGAVLDCTHGDNVIKGCICYELIEKCLIFFHSVKSEKGMPLANRIIAMMRRPNEVNRGETEQEAYEKFHHHERSASISFIGLMNVDP